MEVVVSKNQRNFDSLAAVLKNKQMSVGKQ